MDTKMIEIPLSSKLVNDYINNKETISSLFDYKYQKQDSSQKRMDEIISRKYQRDRLASVLTKFNQKYTQHPSVFDNIEKLKKANAAAVVGGQQAGLLTGPAYTIHKCLSVIKLAKEKEEQLGMPIVPVFWIAGEDHDFDEINHVYIRKNDVLKKYAYKPSLSNNKTSVSKLDIDQKELSDWVETIFQSYGETEFTKDIVSEIRRMIDQSQTIVDFFAFLIHRLFDQYGLVLIDSADPDVRRIESDYFKRFIHNHHFINENVMSQLNVLKSRGYEVALDQSSGSVNLFYEEQGQRELLEYKEGKFVGKNGAVSLDYDQLLQAAENRPELLSNNVVTRPIMQDLLLPTLAFIAGPGEIAYWSALKEAFRCFDIRMPLIVPRLNLTLVDRRIEKWLKEKNVDIEEVLNNHLGEHKKNWLNKQHEWNVDGVIGELRQKIEEAHQPVQALAVEISRGLEKMSQKNLQLIVSQIDYIEKKMKGTIKEQYKTELDKFDWINDAVMPMGQPQERVWSIFCFINAYGFDLIGKLMAQTYQFNGAQHVVKI
ncbi:bacillithiol biosynthesis cysteine-adding enzyme BshC [Scopulibacillus daqui]|uniref:Putative cysteine ligase BshC n=1 Tax=Scopulibacillus daqui TaxID=1469162 RepID=A0ABS2PWL3_9BACL|nr:bacillithiol biosynthesis cysteine-adding enzyme BshC [Scopulibacillus daqui]MBM7644256.1 bacillithiol biosynthesis cysteine-adding enzyme BshC [Scopulibacillus daqui]